jgi:hypothetical protein
MTPLVHILIENFFSSLVVQMPRAGSTIIRPKAGFLLFLIYVLHIEF